MHDAGQISISFRYIRKRSALAYSQNLKVRSSLRSKGANPIALSSTILLCPTRFRQCTMRFLAAISIITAARRAKIVRIFFLSLTQQLLLLFPSFYEKPAPSPRVLIFLLFIPPSTNIPFFRHFLFFFSITWRNVQIGTTTTRYIMTHPNQRTPTTTLCHLPAMLLLLLNSRGGSSRVEFQMLARIRD